MCLYFSGNQSQCVYTLPGTNQNVSELFSTLAFLPFFSCVSMCLLTLLLCHCVGLLREMSRVCLRANLFFLLDI